MTKASTLRATYNRLRQTINNTFEDISGIEDDNEKELLEDIKDRGDLSNLLSIERRDTINGKTIDCYVISASNSSIAVINSEDETMKLINFNDISNVYDKISLLEVMEKLDNE